MFAEFELAIHEQVEKGGSLSGPQLTKIYGDLLRRYHGHDQGVLKIDEMVTRMGLHSPLLPQFLRLPVRHLHRRLPGVRRAHPQGRTRGGRHLPRHAQGRRIRSSLRSRETRRGGSRHAHALSRARVPDERIMDQIEAILAKQKK
jgi:hypothetical protein